MEVSESVRTEYGKTGEDVIAPHRVSVIPRPTGTTHLKSNVPSSSTIPTTPFSLQQYRASSHHRGQSSLPRITIVIELSESTIQCSFAPLCTSARVKLGSGRGLYQIIVWSKRRSNEPKVLRG